MPVVGPRRYVRALVATCALGAGTVLGVPTSSASAAAAPTVATVATADEVPVDEAPLGVAIRSITPGTLPTAGNIVVTGTVTNRTDEVWDDLRLYAVVGDGDEFEPMRNQGELELAMATEPDEVVGFRKTQVGTPGAIEELGPGETAGYTIVLPADSVDVSRPGVYWFGVHALGDSDSVPDDDLADGRARTFLPYVPRRYDATPVAASVVVPLTQPVRYAADGSVDDVPGWEKALGDQGRMTRLLDLADASDDPLTWLVDPALVDAIAHLAAGNGPRDLGPVVPNDDPSGEPDGSPTGQPGTDPEESGGTDETDETDEPEPLPPVAGVAAAWLERLGASLQGDEVLALPYGNIDVPATLAHDPQLLEVALAQRSAALEELGVQTRPALTSPSGYLDADTIRAAPSDARVLVTDRMFGDRPPAAAQVDGHRLLVTSYGATQGSPGPARTLSSIGIRQRLLAEAAVRVIKNERRPLVATMPLEWPLDDAASFWAGLDVPWLDLGTLGDVDSSATATTVAPDDLDYTRLQERRELDAATVDAVAGLIEAGDRLQDVLIDNTGVGGTVTEEALTGLSYFARYGQTSGRLATGRSRAWVDARLGGVRISASPGVTLSSASGEFVVTLTNTLDHRVAVSVRAESDDGIEVVSPDRVVLPPRGRQSILLEARTTTNAVHNVTLMVTDSTGAPLGSTDTLPIRPTQVSGVIWLIMGTGAGLLFLAIAVRLVRRVSAARRGDPDAGRRSTRAQASQSSSRVEAV
ncbi:MAG: hypothetical protein JWN84_1835 [Nocardioides sp.]|nr:hypothetical protein [Nocardioides sp.]